MRQVQLFVLFGFALFFQLQLLAQTANFTEGCSPLEVQFTAPSGLSAYFWDFGNNGSSDFQNPSRVFNSPGTYEVTLSEGVGGAQVGTLTISVYPKPRIEIAADPPGGCPVLTTQFSLSSDINPNIDVDYLWSFDAFGTSTDASPIFTFENLGTYDVALALESSLENCSRTELFEEFLNVTEAPEVSFTTDPSPAGACAAPFNVDFTITSNPDLTYEWDFGDGTTYVGANPPTHTYTNTGIFLVALSGTDGSGCTVTRSTLVSVGPPAVAFSTEGPFCVGTSVAFENMSADGSYTWDFGDGTTSSEVSPAHDYAMPGTYEVTLTVESSANCTNSSTQTIEVGSTDAGFTTDPVYTCDGQIIVTYTPNNQDQDAYEWLFPDSTTSNEVIAIDTISAFDTTIYSVNMLMEVSTSLTVTSPEGCISTSSETITIDRPNAEFMPDTISGCAPLEVVFADSSISNVPLTEWLYDFDNGDTMMNTTGDDVTYTFTEPGEYDVVLITTTEFGCKDTSYAIQILVGEAIQDLNFSADQTTICIGDTINFEGISGNPNIDAWHFETDGGRSFHCYQDPNMAWDFKTGVGTMDVSLTAEYNGCLTTETKEDFITINGPLARISYNIDCETPNTVEFRDSSLDATSVLWDFGDEMTSTELNPAHTYADTGDYVVVLTVMNDMTGCPASTDTATVCIRNIKAEITLDTTLCTGTLYLLDATKSENVDNRCWRGYTWDIPNQNRPITTSSDAIEFIFGTPGPETVELVVTDINACTDTATLDIMVYEVLPDFTFDPAPICFPSQEVTFIDQTVSTAPIETWEWDFGDGTTAMGDTTTHAFASSPASVTLIATDSVGCDGNVTITVPEYQPFSTITQSETVICVGESVDFSASDFTSQGSNLSFDWDFGNGTTSTNQTETIQYDAGGIYEITLNFTEIATGCSGFASTTLEVQEFPQVGFDLSVDTDEPICTPAIIGFTNTSTSTSPVNYSWDLGDGNFGSSQDAANNYSAGTYTVSLTASTYPGECESSESFTFEVLESPQGAFALDANTICNGGDITFSLLDTFNVSTYSWDFGDGSSESDINPVTHTYDLAQGTGSVSAILTLTSLDGFCETTFAQTITVSDPVANFEPTIGCDGTVIFANVSGGNNTYEWDFGDNSSTSSDINPSYVYTTAGDYTVTLTATDINNPNCVDVTNQIITIDDPVVAAFSIDGGSTISCDGFFAFSNTSINASSFEWDFGGQGTTNDESPTFTFSTPGVYEVNLIASNPTTGCDDSFSISVSVESVAAQFVPSINDPCTFIVDFVVTPDPQATQINWDFGGGNQIGNVGNTYTVQYPSAGSYDVALTTTNPTNGCSNTSSTTVNLDEPEILENQTFGPIEANLGEFYDPQISDLVVGPYPFPVFSDTTISVVVGNACGTAQYTYEVVFSTPVESLLIPNVFTPNDDDQNDFFNFFIEDQVGDLPELDVVRFEVYNRWGQKVYDNDTPNRGWDGKYNEKDCNQDVYIYIIEVGIAGSISGDTKVFQGDITLLR